VPLTFQAQDNDSEWSLLSVLTLLSHQAAELTWEIKDPEFAPSPGSDRAEGLLKDDQYSYQDVLAALALNPQLIAGAFIGRQKAGAGISIKIETVRGDQWNVYSNNPQVLEIVRSAVAQTTPIPE
jgi:hypothetical protein